MTETQLFVSSCSRRELAKRRHSWRGTVTARIGHPALSAFACIAICAGAFIAGRGGI